MKILITGIGGLLGQALTRVCDGKHDVIGVDTAPPANPSVAFRELDLTHQAETYQVITRENPDLVIHTAAFNNVDECERSPITAYLQNSIATRNVALACQRFDTVMMHVSTDYVFSGDDCPKEGYREFDRCDPKSRYAESKRWGEIHIQELLNRFYVVRTSWLFGKGRPTFVEQIINAAREKAPYRIASDMVSVPTRVEDLAPAMIYLAEQNAFGVYHVTNGGECDRWEYVEEILRHAKVPLSPSFKKMTRAELALPAHRPKRSTLRNLHWESQGFKPLRNWKDALKEHLQS